MEVTNMTDEEIKEKVYELYTVYEELNAVMDSIFDKDGKATTSQVEECLKKIVDTRVVKKDKRVRIDDNIVLIEDNCDNYSEKVI